MQCRSQGQTGGGGEGPYECDGDACWEIRIKPLKAINFRVDRALFESLRRQY